MSEYPHFAFSIDNCKSYASETNLITALRRWCPEDRLRRVIIVRNRQGRYTAVFPASAFTPNIAVPAHYGFLVIS